MDYGIRDELQAVDSFFLCHILLANITMRINIGTKHFFMGNYECYFKIFIIGIVDYLNNAPLQTKKGDACGTEDFTWSKIWELSRCLLVLSFMPFRDCLGGKITVKRIQPTTGGLYSSHYSYSDFHSATISPTRVCNCFAASCVATVGRASVFCRTFKRKSNLDCSPTIVSSSRAVE